jgi:hypothetical protein
MRTIVLGIVLLVCASTSACGDDGNPTSPDDDIPLTMFIQFSPAAMSVSLNVSGQAFSAAGQYEIRLPEGTHSVSGTMTPTGQTGQTLVLLFQMSSAATGGVRPNSVQSASGPLLQTGSCAVAYTTGTTPSTTPRNFSFRFDVVTGTNGVCPREVP